MRPSRSVTRARSTCPAVCREADILVAALGRPAFVTPEFVKPGATVIDVGTTRVEDRAFIETLYPPGSQTSRAFEKRGALVLGDVHPRWNRWQAR